MWVQVPSTALDKWLKMVVFGRTNVRKWLPRWLPLVTVKIHTKGEPESWQILRFSPFYQKSPFKRFIFLPLYLYLN